jgi:hypothetical protein
MEDDYNKYRLGMLTCVIFSVFSLTLKLISIVVPTLS